MNHKVQAFCLCIFNHCLNLFEQINMPPNISSASNPFVKDKSTLNNILPVSKNDGNDSTTKGETLELVWVLIIFIGILHVASIFGIYLMLFSATLLTSVYGKSIKYISINCNSLFEV